MWERDGHQCIICGSPNAKPNAHFIRRSQGGLGIEQNVVTLCTYAGNDCHRRFDEGDMQRAAFIRAYLMGLYPGWDESELYFDKHRLPPESKLDIFPD